MGKASQPVQWCEEIERMLRSAMVRYERLVRYIMSYGEEYDDVLQELRVRLWCRLGAYDDRYRLSTFVFTLVRRVGVIVCP